MTALDFSNFREEFETLVHGLDIDWCAVGFLGANDLVYQFGTDTKVISTVFEAQAAPIIYQISQDHGYSVEGAPQTIYPDFTLTPRGEKCRRIAIDIKTTYRSINGRGEVQKFRYTLGSYTSFLRNGTKNILHPYREYESHWVIGFLYTRKEGVPAKVYKRDAAPNLAAPYCDVEYFVQEKHKIAGTTPGSGNTANIGSFPTSNIDDLREGRGPFSAHGKEVCDDYWRNYGRTADNRPYSNLNEYLAWRVRRPQ